MWYNVTLLIFLLLFAIVFVTIEAKFKIKSKIKEKQNSTLQILNGGNNLITVRMLPEIVKEKPMQSVVMSGFLVLTPLAQLAFASKGATHEELLKIIGMPNDNVTKKVFTLINKNGESFKGVELKMTSQIYVGTKQEFNETFKNISRKIFNSDVFTMDFSKRQQATEMINSWVENQTNHRIKNLVSLNNFGNAIRIVLINAVYFKGKWANSFDTFYTLKRVFHVSRKKTVKLPTMYRKGEYLYGISNEMNAQLLRIPYEGNEMSMLIVLPKKNYGLIALLEKFKISDVLQKAIKSMRTYEVDVFLPKFKIETAINLKPILKNLGAKRIFSSKLSEIIYLTIENKNRKKYNNDLYVSIAIQKAFIDVSEEGAAAVVNSNILPGMMPMAPHYIKPTAIFRADRPFFFAIQANSTTIMSGVIQYDASYPIDT